MSIAAVEVLTASLEYQGLDRPGDFKWDPLNIRPKDEALVDDLQTKELKNGRLAMLGIAGMYTQASLTGQVSCYYKLFSLFGTLMKFNKHFYNTSKIGNI